MTPRQRGRPATQDGGVDPQVILSHALDMVEQGGLDALTMRALAARSGVTPMTIYHHFHDQDGLIKSMAERVLAAVAIPKAATGRTAIAELLGAYHATMIRHPALLLAIFRRPDAHPDQALVLTDTLEQLVAGMGLPPDSARRWTHILIDHTHGAALAVARDGILPSQVLAVTADHDTAVALLLDSMTAGCRT